MVKMSPYHNYPGIQSIVLPKKTIRTTSIPYIGRIYRHIWKILEKNSQNCQFGQKMTIIKTKNVYKRGDCDMYGTDRSGLASNRLSFTHPERHLILPEIISKEPLGMVVRYGDQKWSDIVRWTVYALFIAEEMGLNSNNIDRFENNNDPLIQRFMGELNGNDHPHLGSKLGLGANWSYNIIKLVGNYKEIYERNVGVNTPIGLKRGLNKLYTHGGLLYAPPLK